MLSSLLILLENLDVGWISFKWLVLLGIPIAHYLIWSRSKYVRLINAVPGPKPYPIIGNLLDLNIRDDEFMKNVFIGLTQQYGKIYRLWLGPRPAIVLNSPELIEVLLANPKLINKANEYSFAKAWLGNCMALATGDDWKNRRRLVTPTFHFQILNSFLEVFNEKSVDCARELERAVEMSDGSIYIAYIHNKSKETSMGRQKRSEEEKDIYVKNLHRISQIIVERSVKPWYIIDWVFKLSALGRESKRCVRALHNFTKQVIEDRREMIEQTISKGEIIGSRLVNMDNQTKDEFKEKPKERLAFLDLLIKTSKDGTGLSDNEIREEVDLMMFAGHDTSSSTLSWFLYLIAKHPKKQELLSDELNRVFGDSDRPCTSQDLTELKYLECCVKETLRLYPIAPGIGRRLGEDVEIGGYILPAGVTVGVNFYSLHHDPTVYPDPEIFEPERFLQENSIGRHPYAFIPFSAGPRNCIGQKYALLEIKVVLAHLLRRFRFSLFDNSKPMIPPSFEIVLKPKHGIRLIVSKKPNAV